MLMEVRSNLKIMFLSFKYNLMRAMENNVAFMTSVIMMIFNNASFIIQWITIFSLKEVIGTYTLNDVMLFWALSSGSFGITHIFFNGITRIPDYIEHGKLDAYLTMPKNVLCQVATSSLEPSAVGDLLYGYIALIIFNFSIKNLLLYSILIIFGGLIYAAFMVVYYSLTFKYIRSNYFAESLRDVFLNLSLYPDVIFSKVLKILAFSLIPSGFAVWIPVYMLLDFKLKYMLYVILFTIGIITLAFYLFNKGLKNYSSSNLMDARS